MLRLAWLAQQLPRISGKSPLAAAIRYALTRMERMRPYLDNGMLELDTNTAERGMRAIALGRKKYLLVGSDDRSPEFGPRPSPTP